MELSSTVLDKCGLVDAAILGENVEETGDGVVDYARFFCHHALPAAVASGDGDKSDVSPLHSVPTRSRAQALNKRIKGECVCVCMRVCECV